MLARRNRPLPGQLPLFPPDALDGDGVADAVRRELDEWNADARRMMELSWAIDCRPTCPFGMDKLAGEFVTPGVTNSPAGVTPDGWPGVWRASGRRGCRCPRCGTADLRMRWHAWSRPGIPGELYCPACGYAGETRMPTPEDELESARQSRPPTGRYAGRPASRILRTA